MDFCLPYLARRRRLCKKRDLKIKENSIKEEQFKMDSLEKFFSSRQTSIPDSAIFKRNFIMNAIEDGWSVKKRQDCFIFSKKHEGRREIFSENYIREFIKSHS